MSKICNMGTATGTNVITSIDSKGAIEVNLPLLDRMNKEMSDHSDKLRDLSWRKNYEWRR
jgi:hypothetical protein